MLIPVIEHYESKQSIFHWIDELDSLQQEDSETLRDFATRVQQKSFDVETVVRANGSPKKTLEIFFSLLKSRLLIDS